MANVKVVTDSAADLPSTLADARGITVVPLTVRFGDDTYTSDVDLDADGFWSKLRTSTEHPATAAPSAGEFEDVYRRLAEEGADGVVSVHLSSKLSGTYQCATIAAKAFPQFPIEVVDTLGVSAATGLEALRAAELAERGVPAADIAAELAEYRHRIHLYGVIDTLEYLRRGGRIGGAQALLGSMLKVKPVISLEDGEVAPAGRVRTRQKALEHLAGRVRRHAGRIEDIVLINGDAPDIDTLRELVTEIVDLPEEHVWMLGPVVGTHAGPAVVGVVFVVSP